MATLSELGQSFQALDPYAEFRKGQMTAQKFDIQQSVLDEQTKEIEAEKAASLGQQASQPSQPPQLAKMANEMIPGAKLYNDDGSMTVAGQINDTMVNAAKLAKQSKMMLREASLIEDPYQRSRAMGEARHFGQTAQFDLAKARELNNKVKNDAIYAAVTGEGQEAWDAAIKSYQDSGLPLPEGIPTTYTPENAKKLMALLPAELQSKARNDLIKRKNEIRQEKIDDLKTKEKVVAQARDDVKFLTEYGQPVPVSTARRAGISVEGGEEDVSSTGRSGPESGGDYTAINPVSGALGKYQIMPSTLDSLRKQDPSLPKTDAEFLADPKAQNKAMMILEESDRKSLKADGFKDSNVNLATYHRFGAPDGKKVLSAFEQNPNTPLKNALGNRYKEIVAQNPDLANKSVGQVIMQNYGNTPLPTTEGGTPSGTIRLEKVSTAALPKERAYNVLEATIQAVNDLENISKLSKDTTLGAFAGLTGKDSSGIVSGLTGLLGRTVTAEDERTFEQLASGLESAMATAVGGGYASAATEGKMKQYAKQLPRKGDTAEAGIIAVARMKQELETVMKGYDTRVGASQVQKDLMRKELDRLNKAIPFTIKQVMDAKESKAGGQTIGKQDISKAYPGTTSSGTTVSNW